ncbi:MAG: class I SAM-dependent methyltransferase [Proteobacteria bacterium]|nr:class I SAM-dependent methyltransferase [Pseudomonadota bacterium]
MGDSRSDRWRLYYETTGERPPRETLMHALERFAREPAPPQSRFAVDLGCGSGRDTVLLLRSGFSVLAVDAEAAAIEALRKRPDLPAGAALATRVARFEDTTWPAADLVNASFSLPLCPREAFLRLWARLVGSLKPGGRFAGQLFGERDEWAGDPTITHLRRAEAEGLLADLEVELFREEETDTITPRGRPKHWHLFHVVARKA